MAKNNLPIGPNEGGINQSQKVLDPITSPKETEIAEVLQDVEDMKAHAEEIKLMGGTILDEAVEMLLQKKTEGKNCFINFNGTKIYSADIHDVDDAYMQYYGMPKAEKEEERRKSAEQDKIKEEQRERRKKGYAKKIADSREGLEEVKITKENVVAGLKFMAEHPKMEGNELVDNLINLGCNFTLEDINKQYPNKKGVKLFPGMAEGNIVCGATVIAWCTSDGYADDRFFAFDHKESAYAFIRKVTGDETYTKEYVDSLIKKRGTESF